VTGTAAELDLIAIPAADFDLELTLTCGQVFHWERDGSGWRGAIGSVPCFAEQRGETLLVPQGREALVAEYFGLDHPLPEIYSTFPTDPAMAAALDYCRGLRIIRQPAWECVATFILLR
jgi:N-glycosylase/DNA lyase